MARLFAALCIALSVFASPGRAAATEVWFGAADPIIHRGPTDYMDMFAASAPWRDAAGHVGVFLTNPPFSVLAPEDAVRTMLAGLRMRHIALALQGLMLTGTDRCGMHIEGYSGKTIDIAVERLKRLGADPEYLAMDEPLWFGHAYDGPQACRTPIADLAREVAAKVAVIRGVFPSIKVGDIEPVAVTRMPGWNSEIMRWADAYRQATGEQLAFVQADVQWHEPWRAPLRDLAIRLRSAGIKFGTLYIGDPDDQTNEQWVRHAEERFVAAEADPDLVPDQAILYTWLKKPDRMLPDDMPGTMTNLVVRYAAAETVLTAVRSGDRIAGTLTDMAQHPVAGGRIEAVAFDNRPRAVEHVKLTGTVPANATAALLGLRINTECGCNGPADVEFGTIAYRDERSGETEYRRLVPPAMHLRAGRIVAMPGQAVLLNTPPFAVTPSDPFTVDVPMDASYESRPSGYVTIIFLGQDGKGVLRLNLPLQPRRRLAGTATTDAQGRFTLLPNPDIEARSAAYLVKFNGSTGFRPATTYLQ